MIDFDDILPHIGDYGKYQLLMLALLAPMANIPCGFTYLSIVFISATPDHWCKVPQLEAIPNISTEMIKNLSIPSEDRDGLKQLSNCKMYDLNYTQIANDIWAGNTPTLNETARQVDCKYGWNYDKSTYDSTLVTELDVVCDDRWMQSMAESSFFIGTITGSIVFGSMGNRYGRKATFYVLLSCTIIFGLIAAFPPNYLAYIIYRGLLGTTSIVMFQIPFILAMEMMSPAKRSVSGMFICTAFPFSIMLTAGIACLVRNWFYMSLITSAPLSLFLIVWYFVPESPRWLLTRNRVDEAEAIVQKIAKINKKKIPPNFLHDMMRRGSTQENKVDNELAIVQMLKYPNIRKKFGIISFGWLVNAIVYVGLLLGATMFGINDYLSVTISGLMELPGVIAAWWFMDIVGRRWVIFTSMVLGGISCFCAGFIPPGYPWATLILANIGKLGISASYSVIYVFGSELFPTVLRTLALATASLVGSIGAISAPHILYLGTLYGRAIPVIILGMLSVAGGISTLFLPETLNENLPETVEEGEAFGIGAKFWSCPWSGKKKREVRSASIVSTTQPDYKMHGVMNLGKF